MDKKLEDLRGKLARATAADELRERFLDLTRHLMGLPKEKRSVKAPLSAVRLYNAGHGRLKTVAPILATDPVGPPVAMPGCTLGVVLARSMEVAARLRRLLNDPLVAPQTVSPSEPAQAAKVKGATKRGKK